MIQKKTTHKDNQAVNSKEKDSKKKRMDEQNKKKTELLAVLFGFLFLLIFIYCLVRFLCRIRLEYERERINTRNNRILLANSMNLN